MPSIDRIAVETMIDAAGIDYEIRDDYSGRGMYGDSCFGVVVEPSDEGRVLYAIGYAAGYCDADYDSDDETDWDGLARSARTDSMGLSMILYFPGWTLTD